MPDEGVLGSIGRRANVKHLTRRIGVFRTAQGEGEGCGRAAAGQEPGGGQQYCWGS